MHSTKLPFQQQSTIIDGYPQSNPIFQSIRTYQSHQSHQPYQPYQQQYEQRRKYLKEMRHSEQPFSYSFQGEQDGFMGRDAGKKEIFGEFGKFSQVSGVSWNKDEEVDCAGELAQLQHKIMQQILILRQQKLTLMQHHNQITQTRYKTQRQLNKLKKKLAQQSYQQSQKTKIKTYTETTQADNDRLSSNKNGRKGRIGTQSGQGITYEELTAQECQVMERILNLRQANNQLSIQLYKDTIANKSQKKQPNSLETHLQSLNSLKQTLLKILLTQSLPHPHPSPQSPLPSQLLTLLNSNQHLQSTLNKYMYRQKNRLQVLRERVRKEEEYKKQMLEDIVRVKCQVRGLRMENLELRKAIGYFGL